MTDQTRQAKRHRGDQSAQPRRSPDLDFTNFDQWGRKLMHRGALYRDSNVDDKRLDTKQQTYDRQIKELMDDHGAQWNEMTVNISNKVIDATELDPIYRAIEDRVYPLGLYLLLEKVCTKTSMNNVEALRTQWQELCYIEGDTCKRS
ncbi:hypothetical protein B484DRAFT_406915 [Ochromonadaceae sp. CCMP2298]|nr:hypothetical protein B484DRAFT_406915 [Ochromonadaceae sp. CCMP2298]